ncbi:MAG: hypothetical protein AAB332_02315 [Planctomycetota bacterium]
MDIIKSSRHQKIIGNFGESIICNWLSRSGFEVAVVDHTGIDIVAYNPSAGQRLGITVKSRTRSVGSENSSVTIFSNRNNKNDREKLLNACRAFNCEPWIAVYVEATDVADVYLTSLKNYDLNYRRVGKTIEDWKMTSKEREIYSLDTAVNHIRLKFEENNWAW